MFFWNKTDKAPTFTEIPTHGTILTKLEAIRTYQDGIADEVSVNIVAELRKRGISRRFSEEMMQSVLGGMWNDVEYALKDSLKVAGQVEECYD